ncbi:MAG: serine--tRNA ligase [archaeon]|nr:serine--tRNA ligase [archaeon]
MLDIKLFRENPDEIKEMLEKRNLSDLLAKVDDVLELDKVWKRSLNDANNLRAERNIYGREVGRLKKAGEDAREIIEKGTDVKNRINEMEIRLQEIDSTRFDMLKIFPNMIHPSVPVGMGEDDNVPIKWVGIPNVWSGDYNLFKKYNDGATVEPNIIREKPPHHADIVVDYDLVELNAAVENAGSRFVYEKDSLVDLDLALILFAYNKLRKKGFNSLIPPYLVRRHVEEGGTDLDVFSDVLYKIEGEDLYLIPTSEHPIAAMISKLNIREKELPIRYVAFSPCFRREAGSHGKDTKGIFRVHQFHKIEEYSIAHPTASYDEFEFLRATSEEIAQDLGFPYRVVELCTEDMDKKAAKQYDIEGWFPGQGLYRELTSTGNVTDWQARRLGIKYQARSTGNLEYAHTVYSTGIAVQRTMTCILENNMQEDGSIKIPKVLKHFVPFDEIAPIY